MVPAPSHRVPRVPWYSGSRAFCRLPSLTGLSPSLAGLPRAVLLAVASGLAVLTPGCVHPGLGSSGSARRYSRNHFCFLFLRLLRCFSSPGSPRTPIRVAPCSACGAWASPGGSPHSDTRGSLPICGYPRLFAAYRVFLRLLVPRHPPCALLCLTSLSRLAWRYLGAPRPLPGRSLIGSAWPPMPPLACLAYLVSQT